MYADLIDNNEFDITTPNTASEYAKALLNHGLIFIDLAEYDSAEVIIQESLDIERSAGVDELELSNTIAELGTINYHKSNFEQADSLFRVALAYQKSLYGDFHHLTATTSSLIGANLNEMARYAEADSFLHESLRVYTKIYDDAHPDVIGTLTNLGLNAIRLKNYEEAEQYLKDAIELPKAIHGNLCPGRCYHTN